MKVEKASYEEFVEQTEQWAEDKSPQNTTLKGQAEEDELMKEFGKSGEVYRKLRENYVTKAKRVEFQERGSDHQCEMQQKGPGR